MSASEWNDFADELITDFAEEFGNGKDSPQTYFLLETETAAPNPFDPPTVTTEQIPINAVFTSVSSSMIDGTLIKAGDVMITTSYTGTIEQGDKVSRDGVVYTVNVVNPASPYGEQIVNKLVARVM